MTAKTHSNDKEAPAVRNNLIKSQTKKTKILCSHYRAADHTSHVSGNTFKLKGFSYMKSDSYFSPASRMWCGSQRLETQDEPRESLQALRGNLTEKIIKTFVFITYKNV